MIERPAPTTGLKARLASLVRWAWPSLSALLLLELVLRFFLSSPLGLVEDPVYGSRYRPGARVLQSSEGYSRMSVNSDGYLDGRPEAPTHHRVLLLGDSYSAGQQVSYGERFSERLEQLLPGVEIVNSAQGGWYPPFYLAWLESHAPASWDAVIVQLNDGDLFEIDRADRIRIVEDGESGERLVVGAAAAPPTAFERLTRGLMARSALLNLVRQRARNLEREERARLRARFGAKEPDVRNVLPDSAEPRLRYFFERLVELQPKTLCFYIPQLTYRAADSDPKWPENAALYVRAADAVGAHLVDTTPALQSAYRNSGQPLHGFANSQMGEGHLNRSGHEAVAELLASELTKLLELEAAP